MYRIKNTANDRTKTLLHRTASRFEPEPTVAGRRLRLGESMSIEDDHYDRIKDTLDELVRKGIIEVSKDGEEVKTKKEVTAEENKAGDEVVIDLPPEPEVLELGEIAPPNEDFSTTIEPGAEAHVETTRPLPPIPPAPEEKPDLTKKGPGKKKLF